MTSPRLLSLSRLLTTKTTTATAAASTFTRRLTTATPTRLSLLRRISTITPHPTTISLPSTRAFSTHQAQNSMNDNNANWSNRPPKETIMLDGCDFEHWLVVTDPPPEDWTRDQIIDYYVQTLASVIGGEAEARMKIYSVSTKHYFAFGALVDEETSYKLKELEKVRWVLPDSYLDVKNKDYGGEPFIDGQAVPYDPKYHEEWVRNNQKARERNNRNDRPRNNDRSRNFERRQRTDPPGPNMGGRPQPNQIGGQPNNFQQNMQPNNFQQNMPPRNGGYQANNAAGYQQNMPPNNVGYQPNPQPNNVGYQGNMPPNNYQPNIPPNNGGYQQNMAPPNPNAASYQPNMPPNTPPPNVSGNYGAQGFSNNTAPNYQAGGGMPYQNNAQMGGQPNGGFQSQNVPGRDMP